MPTPLILKNVTIITKKKSLRIFLLRDLRITI